MLQRQFGHHRRDHAVEGQDGIPIAGGVDVLVPMVPGILEAAKLRREEFLRAAHCSASLHLDCATDGPVDILFSII